MLKLVKSFYIGLFSIFVCACQPNLTLGKEEKKIPFNDTYQIGFGLQGEQQFIKYSLEKEDRQPAGLGFYNLLWSAPNLAKVNINLGSSGLAIPNTISVLATKVNYDKSMQGIQIIDINSGLNKDEYVTEKQAYLAYKELLEQIVSKGWEQYFFPFSERISKNDNIKSILDNGFSTDPTYILNFNEWKDIFSKTSSINYRLYSNGVILEISLQQNEKNNKGVQHMLRLSFLTIKSDYRNLIQKSYEMNNNEFKYAYLDFMQENKISRSQREVEALAEGYHIDENYQDPDAWSYVK